MTVTRHDLDVYLRSVNEEIQTMKMSSEFWFRSASPQQIRANDRFVRSLMSAGLEWGTSAPHEELPDLPRCPVQHEYWSAVTSGQDVAVRFGAADHPSLEAYFTVDAGRSGDAAFLRARSAAVPLSPADYLLRSIDRIAVTTSTGPADACRKAMRLLSRGWPLFADACRARSHSPLHASAVLREFHESVVTRSIPRSGSEQTLLAPRADGPRVILTEVEARELAASYGVGRLPFTAQEYRMAGELAAMPRLQGALLAAQMHLTAGSLQAVGALVNQLGTLRSLLPFTEAFVNRSGYGPSGRLGLSPNPKLITVLCNNVVPAIAGELLRRGAQAEDLDSASIRAGVVAARRRHIYEVMIGLFDRAQGLPAGMVTLSGFNVRVCPAAAPFSTFLEEWLPFYFDRGRPGG
ncbi:hypothetical protein ABTZ78_00730 [Streptomyces bauhiniae]|uniref:hypothetical protein n=1 Tax=Streptomyces bauhiniae TaxID=2340725 RepID=UPI003331AE00